MSGRGSNPTLATYTVELRDRETGEAVPGCNFNEFDLEGEFTYSNAFAVTEASVIVDQTSCADCGCEAKQRQHELVITRSDWPEPAFVGPLLRVVDDPLQRTIRYVAQNRLFWWVGAAAERPFDVDGEVVEVARGLMDLADEYQAANLDYDFSDRGGPLPPRAGFTVPIDLAEGASIYDKLLSLAKSSIDGSVVGPHLYWGSPSVPVERGPTLISGYWKDNPPITDSDGTSAATQVRVTGAGGIEAVYPEADVDLGYGRKVLFFTDTNIDGQNELDALARELFEQNNSPTNFLVTGDGSLGANAPVALHRLIPGRLFETVAQGQCLSTSEILELANVVVGFGSSISNGSRVIRETRIAVDLQAPGTLAAPERASA